MSTREKMNIGELYTDMDEGLPEERGAGKERVYDFNLTRPSEEAKRLQLLRSIMGSLGESCWIEPPLRVAYGTHIHIGNHFYANFIFISATTFTLTSISRWWMTPP